MEKNPQIATLNPFAIVLDLARGYHSFAATFFPASRTSLNRQKHVLSKRNDSLGAEQLKKLTIVLDYSDELAYAYALKEQLINWYDCSFDYQSACYGLKGWLANGHKLGIPEIENALKTFENWQVEILNYHKCPFTNGIVEGRNGKIKSVLRRYFFLRNRISYKTLCFIECNRAVARDQFKLLRV